MAIYLALGANLAHPVFGPPQATLQHASGALERRGVHVLARSALYESPPMPPSGQPPYINAVIAVTTPLPALALLHLVKEIESQFGRVAAPRNAARVLDIDIIDFDGLVQDSAELILPHPRLSERPFVLYPLQEIAPDWRSPASKQGIGAMIAALPQPARIIRLGPFPL
jgi:2-amino-4-hydroxy-6-hydroxymethyldihydropteridine diphosphokinase